MSWNVLFNFHKETFHSTAYQCAENVLRKYVNLRITVNCKQTKKKYLNKEGKVRASRLRSRNQNEISQISKEIQKHIWTSMKGFVNDARQSSVVTLTQGLALIEQWVEIIKCVKWSQEKAGLVAVEIAHSFFTDPTLGRGGFALHPPLYTPLRPH